MRIEGVRVSPTFSQYNSPLPPAFAPDIGEVEIAMIESTRIELTFFVCQLMLVIGDDTKIVWTGRFCLLSLETASPDILLLVGDWVPIVLLFVN